MDILIFSGQSNMQGQTHALPEPNDAVDGAFEYRYTIDSLIPLRHPCGEDLPSAENPLLDEACDGHGSMIPDTCREYVRLTGRRVTAIHVAKGGSSVGEWQKGTERYDLAIRKIRAGVAAADRVEKVERIYLLWLQGESDAIYHTSGDDYARMLTRFKDDLKTDAGIECFGIIKVGYFCGTVNWLSDRTRDEGRADDEIIMEAQERLCESDGISSCSPASRQSSHNGRRCSIPSKRAISTTRLLR